MIKTCKKFLVTILAVLTSLFCVFFIAGCDKMKKNKAPGAVTASSIKYDGYKCTWGAVSGAEEYIVKFITLKDGKEATREYSRPDTSFSYNGSSYDSVEISITAKNTKGSSSTVNKLFTRIDPLDSSKIVWDEDGVLSWEATEEANEYILNINGKEVVCEYTSYADFEIGKNTVKIMPTAPDTYSAWSSAVSMTFLDTPTLIKYDGEFISWKGVQGATKYEVVINGGNVLTPQQNMTSVEYLANGEDFAVTVQAVGVTGTSISSEVSEEKRFYSVDTITEYDVNLGKLTWTDTNTDIKITGYEVKTNMKSSVQTVSKAEFDGLVAGASANKVKVKPIVDPSEGEAYFSSWSEEWSITLLPAPTLMWNSGLAEGLDDPQNNDAPNALYWNDVQIAGVANYKVFITDPDGIEDSKVQGGVTYGNWYEKTGTWKVSVQTLAEADSDVYDSKPSEVITINRLKAPDRDSITITSDPYNVLGNFRVTWEAVNGEENGYKIWMAIGNSTYDSTSYYTSKNVRTIDMSLNGIVKADTTARMEITYGIQTRGYNETFGTQKRVTLPSLKESMTSEFGSNVKVTVLSMPTNVAISGYDATWTAGDAPKGYAVAHEKETEITAPEYSFMNLKSGDRAVDFKVCAKGDGKAIFPSNYTEAISVYRLGKPTGVRVDTEINEGQVYCTDVLYAQSYDVYFNSNSTPVNTSSGQANVSKYLQQLGAGTGVNIQMTAVANYYKDNDPESKTYYVTSEKTNTKQFTQLAGIKFQETRVVGTKLKWNAPSNSPSGATNYKVFINDRIQNERPDSTEFDISALEAGKQYSFKVQAMGDGNEWLNSDINASQVVDLYKLQAPTVTRTENAYRWSPVPMGTNYGVVVDSGNPVNAEKDGDYYKYVPTFDSIGSYIVKIYAKGDGKETIDSTNVEITQRVEQLSAPNSITVGYDKEWVQSDGSITVTVNQAVANASGYRYRVGGATNPEVKKDLSYSMKPNTSGAFDVSVQAVGSVFDADNVYWLDSQQTYDKIVLLDTPSASTITLSDSTIAWHRVTTGGVSACYSLKLWNGSTELTAEDVGVPSLSGCSGVSIMGNFKKVTKVELWCVGPENPSFVVIRSASVSRTFSAV